MKIEQQWGKSIILPYKLRILTSDFQHSISIIITIIFKFWPSHIHYSMQYITRSLPFVCLQIYTNKYYPTVFYNVFILNTKMKTNKFCCCHVTHFSWSYEIIYFPGWNILSNRLHFASLTTSLLPISPWLTLFMFGFQIWN